jgi:hypothetical protein
MPKKFLIGSKKSIIKTGVTFAYEVDEFRKAPRFYEIYDKIKELFNGRIVLGFSLANDIKYINNACDFFKLERICYEFYDIQFIYQLLHPEEKAVGLKTLNQKYSIEYIEHRSDEDAFSAGSKAGKETVFPRCAIRDKRSRRRRSPCFCDPAPGWQLPACSWFRQYGLSLHQHLLG